MSRAVTRRDRNAEMTRSDLFAAGLEVFMAKPYAEVSAAQICDRAGVSRGALQHHYGSKLGLFTVLFEKIQNDVTNRIINAVAGHVDPWEQAYSGIAAFLEACTSPEYQAIVLKEGPTAIGWRHWRELDAMYFSSIVDGLIALLAADGLADHPPELLAALIRGTLTEMSFEIAQSEDHHRTLDEALGVIRRLLAGFRTVNEVPPASPQR